MPLAMTSPSVTTVCTAPTSGGKFKLHDRVFVRPATGGMQIRDVPDLNADWVPPFQPPNAEGLVDCVRLIDAVQWVRIDFDEGVDGWARETGFDKVGGIVVDPPPPPPPPIDVPPVAEASYYVASNGNDSNPGTLTLPFATIQKGASLLKPGQMLIVRGGEYDATSNSFTTNGSTSSIPSGNSWQEPVTIRAYPGEHPVLRRFMPTGSLVTEAQMRGGIHLATPAECKARVPQTPYPCWSGGGFAPDYLSWLDVATFGWLDGAVFRIYGPSRYIIIDGIDIDGRGIVAATLQLSCNAICGSENGHPGEYDGPTHMRFQNLEIRNAIASCTAQPGSASEIQADLQFINVKIHHCGVPYDTNFYADNPNQGLARFHPNARFYHPWYMHTGGNTLKDSETYATAGTGLSPDGDNNVITGNYIHDNASHGILIGGGKGWRIEGNTFRNNGGIEIYANAGQPGHYVAHNTILKGPKPTEYSWGIYLGRGAYGMQIDSNIIDGFATGIRNDATYLNFGFTPNNSIVNNLIRAKSAGSEIVTGSGTCPECPVPPLTSGNLLGVDPKLDANFRATSETPPNVGAR